MSITQEGKILKLTTPLAEDFLLIKRFRANEGLNRLFEVEIDILHEETEEGEEPTLVNPQDVLGQPMTVSVKQLDDTERYFNGICIEFSQGNRDERFSKYKARVVPKVWLLTQVSQSRIFQNKNVPDIIREVLSGYEVDYEIQGTFEPRNYCVQYRETDFNFISRLMEEEGIYYYFEHTAEKHRMIIANTPQSHRDCPSKAEMPFVLDSSELGEEWVGAVHTWRVDSRLRTGKYTLWDHNFQLPTSKLNAEQTSRFSIGGNQNLEFYDFPGDYGVRFDGIDQGGGDQNSFLQKVFEDRQRTVQLRQQEIDVAYKNIYATSDCCALTAGYRFKLNTHPNSENNIHHILVSVKHEATQSPSYVSGDSVRGNYLVDFFCIPHGSGHAPFRPLRKTVKPVVTGSQTAMVVGPAGEEIFTDKYGRVKVQFHWDRQGRNDANSSCWVRVGTLWAGKQWGVIHIPRIGQEVIVDFIEGNPDLPIIVGSVYNPQTMPPYELPENKTQSGVKSRSSKGGSDANFNEFRFEDKKGSEEIYLHAEKNWTIMVENDKNQVVGHNETLLVKNDRTKTVDNNETTLVKGNRTETVNGDETITITGKGGNRTESVEKNEKITIGKDRVRDVIGYHTTSVGKDEKTSVKNDKIDNVGNNYTLSVTNDMNESAKKITISAGVELVLSGPGGSIKIDAGGVTITGVLVKIN